MLFLKVVYEINLASALIGGIEEFRQCLSGVLCQCCCKLSLAVLWRGKFCVGLLYNKTAYCFSIFIIRNKAKNKKKKTQQKSILCASLRAAFFLEM